MFSEASGIPQDEILDFSANINPLGPPPWLRSVVSRSLDSIDAYPDPDCSSLKDAICEKWNVSPGEVVIGNGSSEILFCLPRVLDVDRALIPVPAYVGYAEAARAAHMDVIFVGAREDADFALDIPVVESMLSGSEAVFIARPNNPTGLSFDTDSLRELAERHRKTIFIIDEAFAGFAEGMESLVRDRPSNFIIVVSLTKIYGIPGARLGFAVADPHIIEKIEAIKPPWSVNMIAQAVGEEALRDEDFLRQTVAYVAKERQWLISKIRSIDGLKVFEGAANFLLIRSDRPGTDAKKIFDELLKKGLAIRVCDNFEGLDKRYFRIAVRTESENRRLVEALRACFGLGPFFSKKAKTPALMFQGLSSNAGKSVMTAALCRILFQDGYEVFPFKAQNMSLNSFVTIKGGEMGRAQVVQAQACRQDPDVRMNPILLKPNSDTGSQVILNGTSRGNMKVKEYIRAKPHLFESVKAAYDDLAGQADCVVLEGAGSPAEINLKHHDIVNMRMADYAGARVLLVGDIDRGGVFSSFIGTMEVLEKWERNLVAGFVINRFRGDPALLDSALKYTEDYTGRPIFGVVPFMENLGLPEEDSVGFKRGDLDRPGPKQETVEIAVIDLPHISNFTDFDPFYLEPDVHLRIVRSAAELNCPEVVVLPGSKNVIGDLTYLRENKLDEKIIALVKKGRTQVVGICGGFQMLGSQIRDPLGLESDPGESSGLGLLPMTTTLESKKTLTHTKALHLQTGLQVHGYEIHHGLSDTSRLPCFIRRPDGEVIGAGLEKGDVWGTYLHGIFDDDPFRRWFIDRLREKSGLGPLVEVQAHYDLEVALTRLADKVRECLPIDRIYKLMGLK